jgi:hypothetical protein
LLFYQYMRYLLLSILISLCLYPKGVTAQSDGLTIHLNKEQLHPGDTVQITASYTLNNIPVPVATLFVQLVNEEGQSWQLRWPILDGQSETAILFPDSLPQGRYRLYFSALKSFFTVIGQVESPAGIRSLNTVLITGSGAFSEREIPVAKDGSFEYRNSLFANTATLSFVKKKGKNDDLDISISTILDSVFVSTANALVKSITIGKGSALSKIPADTGSNGVLKMDSLILSKAKALPSVVVFGQRTSRASRFNEKYSRGLFRDMNERIIDLLDDNTATGQSALQFLGSRVAGLNIVTNGISGYATWRGDPVQFYMDEMRVDARTINAININDIAIIKLYPPPFTGNPGGFGGAVAIYTKRDDDDGSNTNRNSFRVTGYSPPWVVLPVEPDQF